MARIAGVKMARKAAMAILATTLLLVGVRIAAPATAAPPFVASAKVIIPRPRPAPRMAAPLPMPIATPSPAPLVVSHVIDTGGAIRYGSYFWDDTAPKAGPLTITVDLKASVMSVFRGGYEIGTTAVIYGADSKQTPLGTFPIMAKERRHFSGRYHHAPMPYMLRLTGDGVSIHASEIAADYATHGCIGVPTGFARRLFAIASPGDKVIITKLGMRGAGTTA